MDREKVIKGLECHRIDNNHRINCTDCPYYVDDDNHIRCVNDLHDDAIELLREKDCKSCGTVFDIAYKAGRESIVKCKDCKHRGDRNQCIVAFVAEKQEMPYFFYDNRGDWFCADGEKKASEDETYQSGYIKG